MSAKVGDVWYRVEGEHLGEDSYAGMTLSWQTWRCVRTTPRGAWFSCIEWSYMKPKFALTSGSKKLFRTKRDALAGLIGRKVRHLRMLNGEVVAAQDTLDAARAAFVQMEQP